MNSECSDCNYIFSGINALERHIGSRQCIKNQRKADRKTASSNWMNDLIFSDAPLAFIHHYFFWYKRSLSTGGK